MGAHATQQRGQVAGGAALGARRGWICRDVAARRAGPSGVARCGVLITTRASRRNPPFVCNLAAVEQREEAEEPREFQVPKDDTTWELDFCSRPILDDRGKKLWELLVCDSDRSFEHSVYLPNNRINSVVLKRCLEDIIQSRDGAKPRRVLYFRTQLQTIITRALSELDIKAVQSKRCYAVMDWLDERLETVYSVDPKYDPTATPGFVFQEGIPKDLSDGLRGEKWLFVQMDWASLKDEMADVANGKAFGALFDPADQNLDVTDDTLIPGVAIFSRRAVPLAGWTGSLELSSISPDTNRACLILGTDVSTKWIYGAFDKTEQNIAEAQAWEKAKEGVNGLHFLAVQDNPDAEVCAGLWLLRDRPLPKV